MAYNLKEAIQKPNRMTSGHRMCAGCGAPVVVNAVLRALKEEDHAVIGAATGCLEVSSFMYPYTAWRDSFIHNAFENAGATMSGVEAAYKAMERWHDMVYVCYDNGAYMNTGIQRSSATPRFADTTTSPAGKVVPGKQQKRKDLTEVMAGHHLPYIAQTAAVGNFSDITTKAEKAIYTEGPCFMNVLAPCPRGWGYNTEDLMQINKLAVETCYWPLYEIIDGRYVVNYKPKNKLPVEDFLRPQKRFKHIFKEGNEWMIEELQKEVDERWERLLALEEMTNK